MTTLLDPTAEAVIDGQAYVAAPDFLPPNFIDSVADSLALSMEAQGIPTRRERALG